MTTQLSQIPSSDLMLSGACVRFAPDGVYLHTNTAHASVNIDSVSINSSGDLEVTHSPLGVVVTVICSPDEMIAGMRGIIGGGSGGTGSTKFRFYDTQLARRLDFRETADYDRIASATSNVWLFWLHYLPQQTA